MHILETFWNSLATMKNVSSICRSVTGMYDMRTLGENQYKFTIGAKRNTTNPNRSQNKTVFYITPGEITDVDDWRQCKDHATIFTSGCKLSHISIYLKPNEGFGSDDLKYTDNKGDLRLNPTITNAHVNNCNKKLNIPLISNNDNSLVFTSCINLNKVSPRIRMAIRNVLIALDGLYLYIQAQYPEPSIFIQTPQVSCLTEDTEHDEFVDELMQLCLSKGGKAKKRQIKTSNNTSKPTSLDHLNVTEIRQKLKKYKVLYLHKMNRQQLCEEFLKRTRK